MGQRDQPARLDVAQQVGAECERGGERRRHVGEADERGQPGGDAGNAIAARARRGDRGGRGHGQCLHRPGKRLRKRRSWSGFQSGTDFALGAVFL